MRGSDILLSKVGSGQEGNISDLIIGLRKQVRILGHTLWVPFDKCYAEVLSRMKKHEVAFAKEMTLINTKISVSSHKLLKEYIEARDDRREQHKFVEEHNAAALRKCVLPTFITPLKPFSLKPRKNPDVGSRHRVSTHF